MAILDVKELKKVYKTRFGANSVEALKSVSFSVTEGEYVAIMGESGSGKTTLLNVLAGIDKATSGTVLLDNQNLGSIKESQITAFRRENLGFVFQDFNLLDNFSNEDNIFLPMVLSRKSHKEMQERIKPIADILNINSILKKHPFEISGGQKQRVAVARAMITKPKLILADEPTGALDSRSAASLLDLLEKVNNLGQTILMVTHSTMAASRAKRVLFIKDGILFHQIYKGDNTDTQMYEKISNTLTAMAGGEGI